MTAKMTPEGMIKTPSGVAYYSLQWSEAELQERNKN